MHPILFKIGTFEVHTFGLAMVVAFVAAVALAQARGPRYGVTKAQIGDMAFWAILAGVLGARILFIAQEWHHYSQNLRELMTLQFQGLTSFGGLLFGIGAVMVWAWRKKVPVRNLLDVTLPAFLLGHLIGRFGCLMNGCCFGGACPTDLPWGIHVANSPVLHHPAQVYDSLMNVAALGIVLLVENRAKLRAGQVAGLAIALHGVTRFIYEFWRAGTEAQVQAGEASSTYWAGFPLHITQAQGMAFALVLLGAVMMVFTHRRAPLPVGDELAAA